MKRLIALLLTALCVFALAGCGSSTEWTMIDIKGQESRLSAQDAAAEQQTGFQSGFHAFSALRFVSFVSRKPVRKMTVVPKTIVR